MSFEDVNEFKKLDKKYDEQFVIDRKNWKENETSLLDLALNVASY